MEWARGVSGDFAKASNWNPAAVPGPANDAIIDVKGTYTVTSSVDETVDTLIIGRKHATLFITGASSFTTTNEGINNGTILVENASVLNLGTTGESTAFINRGNIELGSAANGELVVAGDVLLQGHGKIVLSDGAISFSGSSATLSSDNVISGSGSIGSGLPPGISFTVVNEPGGVIDATDATRLTISGVVDNSGILESTNPERLGTPGGLFINDCTINNTPLGIIEARGPNAQVDLGVDVTIVGGTLETKGADAIIEILSATLDGTHPGNPVNIAGDVQVVDEGTVVLLGTINNIGVVTLDSGAAPWIDIQGNVILEGGGDIKLTNSASGPLGLAGSIFGGTLTNVDNVISGSGTIGQLVFETQPQSLTLINEARGIIDADASTPLVLEGAGTKEKAGIDTNAGHMEATHGGTLLIEDLTIDNYLKATRGTVEAGRDSTIGLENATIVGGFVTAKHGGIVEADSGFNTITGAVVTNAGTIGAEGANLSIIGNVANKGTLDANNATLAIDGAVCGGKATIEGKGEIEFGGASSAHVTFAANADGILKLDTPLAFTGTVSGLALGDYIDLTNINFADKPTINYSPKTHVLTVTDYVSHVTDAITFKDVSGPFSVQSDGNGGTFITDPPTQKMVEEQHGHDTFLFVANLGENANANLNAHNETIDPPKSEHADLAAFLAQALHDGAYPIGHDATDITHHGQALTGGHVHGPLV